jgi:hypothetical protein
MSEGRTNYTDDIISERDLYPVQRFQLSIPHSIYLLPASRFPLPPAELKWVSKFCEALISYAQRVKAGLQLEIIVKQSYLYPDLIDHFVDKAQQWLPRQGVAVEPHKPPPHVPTKEEIEGIDIRSIDLGSRRNIDLGPELTFQICDPAGKEECYKTMLGHGAVNIFLSGLKGEDLYGRWREIFGRIVTDRTLLAMPFFAPLFGVKSFQGVPAGEINTWFETFDLYIGESTEDKGIIIASAENLDPVIANLVKELPYQQIEPVVEVLRW